MKPSLVVTLPALSAALLTASYPDADSIPYATHSDISRRALGDLRSRSNPNSLLFNLIRSENDVESQNDSISIHDDGHDHDHDGDNDLVLSETSSSIASSSTPVAHAGHEHDHGHGGVPKVVLDEDAIAEKHGGPSPPSYGTHDFDDPDVQQKYPGLMLLHVIFMCLAFFGVLPAGIALRSVNHAWHGFSVILFYTFVVLGISSSALYTKWTGSMYEGQRHGLLGYLILCLALSLTFLDFLSLIRRTINYIRAVHSGETQLSFKNLWRSVILARNDHDRLEGYEMLDVDANGVRGEFTPLVKEQELERNGEVEGDDDSFNSALEESQRATTARWADSMRLHRQRNSVWRSSVASDGTLFYAQNSSAAPVKESNINSTASQQYAHHQRSSGHDSHGSTSEEDTLHESHDVRPIMPEDQLKRLQLPADESLSVPTGSKNIHKPSLMKRIGVVSFATAERLLVIFGYVELLSGIAVYTGGCRGDYINVCAAHLIKGGIFWTYGLFSFARFLGAFEERGWAWNRPRLAGDFKSAEFVECLLIFIYGSTNVWMERFGAEPGSPYTTKQVQHISIAVMYFFAGLLGMCLESKRFRRWLSNSLSRPSPSSSDELAPSYTPSFNPFPAVVVGVTGAAMAAHTQDYVFEVQIHMLWGNLLLAAAALRCVTYFFLWVAPKRAEPYAPSRPPTEALASFFLACGGLMFQSSTEELMFAAMRRGHDDQMMFLNVAVAITCLALCWTLAVVAFKGWLKFRAQHSAGGAIALSGAAP